MIANTTYSQKPKFIVGDLVQILKKGETFGKYNDEIQLSGDWRVVLSEIILPTKIEQITNVILTSYSLSGLEDHQRNSFGANVISRPYNGE